MKRSRLKADPEKVRDWMARSRKRVNWRANNPQFRRGRVPGLVGFTQRVFTLYGRRCVVCGGRACQAHHAVPLRVLFTTRGNEVARELGGDARNGVPVCAECHERHENASRRIPRSRLPAGVIEWAREHDFGWYINRTYPRGGER